MPIYELQNDRIVELEATAFRDERLSERYDLQRLLRGQIGVIASDVLIIAEEFSEWAESRRRIDLLGVDRDANLVVFELKRTEEGGHMELQAVRYASMVSTMTFERAVDVYGDFMRRHGVDRDAQTELLEFLEWDEVDEDEFAQTVRIVLVSADFSKELTTSVLWLNSQGLDIRCVRMKPYRDGEKVLVDVQQVIPLPEAEEYTVGVRAKQDRQRVDRAETPERQILRRQFWEGLLEKARTRTQLHANIAPSKDNWISASTGVRGFTLAYLIRQHDADVVLYIWNGKGSKTLNEATLARLQESQERIEQTFGGPLSWEPVENKDVSRVRKTLTVGGYRDSAEKWPEIQDAMIGAMIALEKAFRPYLEASDA